MDPIFQKNPELQEYFETSDGTKFYHDHHARAHARTLRSKAVKTVYRNDAPVAESQAPKEKSKDLTSKKEAKKEKPKKLTPMAMAKLRIEAIEELNTVEEVMQALEDETAKTVIKAGNDRIAAIKASEALDGDEENENIQTK